MDEENKNNEGGTPEWAKNLQESLNDLPNRIKEALTPEPPQEPETDPNQPQEIPVPEIPQQETPEPQPLETQPEPQPEKQKKKSLLDWLL